VLTLTGADTLELLAKAPTPAAAAKLTVTQISAVLKKAHRRDVLAKATAIQQALRTEHLGQADIVAGAYAATVRATIAVLKTLNAEIRSGILWTLQAVYVLVMAISIFGLIAARRARR